MALSRKTYTQTVPGTTQFAVTFPYLKQADVSVEVDGVSATFSWIDASTIQLDSAPAVDSLIELIRSTQNTTRVVDFTDGTTINETQLDKSALQVFYLVQEVVDSSNAVLAEDASGALDAISRKIINLLDPEDPQDAATKAYVDSMVASVVASAGAAAAASAAAAAASEAAAAASASAAATSATNAGTSETNAGASASAAATSASNAATSESNAAASAAAALVSEGNAASAADAAVTAALGDFQRVVIHDRVASGVTSRIRLTDGGGAFDNGIFEDNPTYGYWRIVLEGGAPLGASEVIGLQFGKSSYGPNLSNYEWIVRGADSSVGNQEIRNSNDSHIALTDSMNGTTDSGYLIIIDILDPRHLHQSGGRWNATVTAKYYVNRNGQEIVAGHSWGVWRGASGSTDPMDYVQIIPTTGTNLSCVYSVYASKVPF